MAEPREPVSVARLRTAADRLDQALAALVASRRALVESLGKQADGSPESDISELLKHCATVRRDLMTLQRTVERAAKVPGSGISVRGIMLDIQLACDRRWRLIPQEPGAPGLSPGTTQRRELIRYLSAPNTRATHADTVPMALRYADDLVRNMREHAEQYRQAADVAVADLVVVRNGCAALIARLESPQPNAPDGEDLHALARELGEKLRLARLAFPQELRGELPRMRLDLASAAEADELRTVLNRVQSAADVAYVALTQDELIPADLPLGPVGIVATSGLSWDLGFPL